MLSFDQVALLLSVATLAFFSPGPDMALVMRNVAVGGRRAGFLTVAGIISGYTIHIAAAVGGVGLLIANSLTLFTMLKFAAAAYLLFLGVQSIRAALSNGHHSTSATPGTGRWFTQGFICNALNPKASLFFLSLFTVVLPAGSDLATAASAAVLVTLNIAILWVLLVVTIDLKAVRRAFSASARAVNAVFGTLLIALGARLALMER